MRRGKVPKHWGRTSYQELLRIGQTSVNDEKVGSVCWGVRFGSMGGWGSQLVVDSVNFILEEIALRFRFKVYVFAYTILI